MWDDKTTIVTVEKDINNLENKSLNYVPSLGIYIDLQDGNVVITGVEKKSPALNALNKKGEIYRIKKSDIIERVKKIDLREATSLDEAITAIEGEDTSLDLKIRRPGGGILPMVISTLLIIVITLVVALPIGVGAAIYLNEYARPGKVLRVIRFAIQNLAGIPSIIYGLFGMLFFVQFLKMQYSVLAGSLTLSIMLLPTIISTTEETLKEVPNSYRQGSYGLGATKIQTITRVILPSALPGILVAIILSIGRIVGESAALIWTAGTVAQVPRALFGSGAAAATLTTKMFWEIQEASNIDTATSIAVVLIVLVVLLNLFSKLITNKFLKRTGTGK
ncbi:MAG: phosphate ABC transporter permease PstA [Clostridiales bacterium]|nr:phosphate ABC transporter permease PstA [Clostridiales bacterium]